MLRTPVVMLSLLVAGAASAQSFGNTILSATPTQWLASVNAASSDGSDRGGLKMVLTREGAAVRGVATEEKGARRFLVNGRLTQVGLALALHEEGVGAQCAYVLQPAGATSYSGERNCAGRTTRATLSLMGR